MAFLSKPFLCRSRNRLLPSRPQLQGVQDVEIPPNRSREGKTCPRLLAGEWLETRL